MIASGAGMDQLRLAAIGGGMRGLYDSAIQCAKRGDTTLDEVERVVGLGTDAAAANGVEPAVTELAAHGSDAAPTSGAAAAGTPVAAPANTKASLPPKPRILLVEDEKVNRKV